MTIGDWAALLGPILAAMAGAWWSFTRRLTKSDNEAKERMAELDKRLAAIEGEVKHRGEDTTRAHSKLSGLGNKVEAAVKELNDKIRAIELQQAKCTRADGTCLAMAAGREESTR